MEVKPLLITATDGNHGYALAFAAKLLGCEAIIFMPKVINKTIRTLIHEREQLTLLSECFEYRL